MTNRPSPLPGIAIGLCLLGIALAGVGLSLSDDLPPMASPVAETVLVRETVVTTATPTETAVPTLTQWDWYATATARAIVAGTPLAGEQAHAEGNTG